MASAVIGALRVTLGLDSAEFTRGIGAAKREARGMDGVSKALATSLRGVGAALGIASFGAAAKTYIDLADKSAKLTAQLKLATAESGSFGKAQSDVSRIARTTASDLSSVADLYAVFQRNARELGITQDQAARSTETITKAFKISGATAAEAAGGMRQLLQGIQSGVLRGEELNSVMENAPRLAKALADGLDVGVGRLREMGSAGELTGEKVVNALESASAKIDMEFAQIPYTFTDAMQIVENSAVETFGAFDRGGGFSEMIASFFMQGADGFSGMASDATLAGIEIRAQFEGLYDAFTPFLNSALGAFNEINKEAANTGGNLRTLLGIFDKVTEIATDPFGMRFVTGQKSSLATNFQGRYDEGYARAKGERADKNWQFQAGGYSFDAFGNRKGAGLPAPVRSSGGGAGSKKAGGAGGKSEEQMRKEAEREAKRAADNLRRFTDDLARSQADLQSALAEFSGSVEARTAAELNQIEQRRLSGARAVEADQNLDEAQRKSLLLLNDQNAEADKQLARQRAAQQIAEREARIIEDRNALATELLQHTAEMARTAEQSRAVELRILDLAFESERARLEQIKATNAATSAEYQYAQARLNALPQLQKNATEGVNRSTMGPMESFLDKLPRSADEAREALERVQVDGINGIVDGLAAAATGAQSLGDVFKNVAKQIIADLIRIEMQKAIVGGIGNALGGIFGGAMKINTPGIGDLAGSIGGSSALQSIPAFATGGSFKVGGSSAVGDKNLVSFRANAGEIVDIRKGENSGGGTFQIIPSPYFDVAVNGQIMRSAPGLVEAGANGGVAKMAQRNSRRVS